MKALALLLGLLASPAAAADLGLGFGYFSLPIAGLGLVGHGALRPDLYVEIALYRGVYNARSLLDNTTGPSVEVERFQVSGGLDTLGLQYFLSEHFFTSAAIGYRQIAFDLQARNTFDHLHEKLKAESAVFRFGLGHRWLFDSGIYFTGEWAAFCVPVTSMVSTEITTEGAVGDAIASLEEDALEQVRAEARRTTYGITAQIGWQF